MSFVEQFLAFIAEKISVFDQQGIVGHRLPKLLDQLLFGVMPATINKCKLNMRSQFDEAHFANLREQAISFAAR